MAGSCLCRRQRRGDEGRALGVANGPRRRARLTGTGRRARDVALRRRFRLLAASMIARFSSGIAWGLLAAGLAFGALAMAATGAHADVMEIGGGEARWVTGGPPKPVAASPVTEMAGGSSPGAPSLGPKSLGTPKFAPLSRPLLTSRFGMRLQPILGFMRQHQGVDLAAPIGTPVYATAGGIVSSAGVSSGYGLLIQLDHAGAIQTRYAHLSRLAVSPGQQVAAGQLIGYTGTSGLSTGPHLHYEVRVGGVAVDPIPYMS